MTQDPMTATMKPWKTGVNGLAVSIPKLIIDLQQIEHGDYVEVTYKKITSNKRPETTKREKRGVDSPRPSFPTFEYETP